MLLHLEKVTADCSVHYLASFLQLLSNRTPVNVARLEEFVNSAIAADHLIQSDELAREEVLSNPRVVRIPGEIYPDKVRLVRCGDVSLEPCCGT